MNNNNSDDIFNFDDENGKIEGLTEVEERSDTDLIMSRMLSLGLMPKPFGCTWTTEQMANFLRERGYRVVERFNEEEFDDVYYVAAKKDEIRLPDDGKSNILELFVEEVQGILLKWLLKIGKEVE